VPASIGARAAVFVPGQAEFNPIPYVRGLAERIPGDGSYLLTGTRVLDMVRGSEGGPNVIHTNRGDVLADQVVIATHVPIFDRRLYFARQVQQRSYAIAVRCEQPLPVGMYISIDSPTRSLRNHHGPEGEIAIVGGEGHPAGHGHPTDARYRSLAQWAVTHLGPCEVTHHWSAQDPVSADGLPFAGPADRSGARVFVITGLRKWGMTNGTAAALMVCDQLLGRETVDRELFDPGRHSLLASARRIVTANARVARDFVGDRLAAAEVDDPGELEPGQGAIAQYDGQRVAAYRDEEGELHLRSPVCTHLGCHVRFNEAERSWDCPCHGSRYSIDGEVLEGPAREQLAPIKRAAGHPRR
jgi:nitrite reductase/ring-hydroxylating ferredoxin subunit